MMAGQAFRRLSSPPDVLWNEGGASENPEACRTIAPDGIVGMFFVFNGPYSSSHPAFTYNTKTTKASRPCVS